MDKRDIADQLKQEMRGGGSRRAREETRARRCGNCNATGHNARTCKGATEAFNLSTSDVINIDS